MVPLIGFIVVPLGLLAAFLTPVSTFAAQLCLKACHAILRPVLALVDVIAEIPFAAVKTVTPTASGTAIHIQLSLRQCARRPQLGDFTIQSLSFQVGLHRCWIGDGRNDSHPATAI